MQKKPVLIIIGVLAIVLIGATSLAIAMVFPPSCN